MEGKDFRRTQLAKDARDIQNLSSAWREQLLEVDRPRDSHSVRPANVDRRSYLRRLSLQILTVVAVYLYIVNISSAGCGGP